MKIYKKFIQKVTFPYFAKRNGLPTLVSDLSNLENTQYWPKEKIKELQFRRLKSLLIHSYETTDFYKNQFDVIGFNPYKFSEFTEFLKIPELTKDIIRKNLSALTSSKFNRNELHHSETGGTSGVKMKFYRNNGCLSAKEAALYRFEKWSGWEIGDRMGLIWPARQDYVGHWTIKEKVKNEFFGRQIVFPAAILDEEIISNYVKMMLKKKPKIIRAFTSPVYEVSKYIVDKGIDFSLKGIITTGEPLYPHQRNMISKAFNCDVFDSYRSREAGPLAQECEKHNGMHVNAESLYVESVQAGKDEGDAGEILVTDLLNYGMPLIRYKIGDVGLLSNRACSCGRGLPLLKKLSGRSADNFYTPQRKKIAASSLVLYVVDEAPGLLGQVQIIQDKIDHLIIRYTPDPEPTEKIFTYQENVIKDLFGDDMKVTFEKVEAIPAEKSGKYMFAKCLLSEAEINNS